MLTAPPLPTEQGWPPSLGHGHALRCQTVGNPFLSRPRPPPPPPYTSWAAAATRAAKHLPSKSHLPHSSGALLSSRLSISAPPAVTHDGPAAPGRDSLGQQGSSTFRRPNHCGKGLSLLASWGWRPPTEQAGESLAVPHANGPWSWVVGLRRHKALGLAAMGILPPVAGEAGEGPAELQGGRRSPHCCAQTPCCRLAVGPLVARGLCPDVEGCKGRGGGHAKPQCSSAPPPQKTLPPPRDGGRHEAHKQLRIVYCTRDWRHQGGGAYKSLQVPHQKVLQSFVSTDIYVQIYTPGNAHAALLPSAGTWARPGSSRHPHPPVTQEARGVGTYTHTHAHTPQIRPLTNHRVKKSHGVKGGILCA